MIKSRNLIGLKRSLVIIILIVSVTVFYSCGGDDKPNDPEKPPVISIFQANPTDIIPGDSSLLTYQVSDADSVVLFPIGAKLASASSGSLYLKPQYPTEFTLVAYNSVGTDTASITITMNSIVPLFISFTAEPEAIVVGDSALLSWDVLRIDSLVIDNGAGKSTTGQDSTWVKPSLNTVYTGIAYNAYGTDTTTVTVDVPFSFSVLNGQFYKSEMNSSVQNPLMQFQVKDINSASSQNAWVKAAIIEGDGALSSDSVQPGSNDTASLSYDFSGDLGYAVVRTWVEDIDTTDLFLRAKTILPGDLFQGQYILYGDTYTTVQTLNGSPDFVDDVGGGILAVVYENSQGAVFLVGEVGAVNGQISQMDTVYYIIITSPDGGTTADGLTVGSTYPEMVAALGTPQSSYASVDYPSDTILYYDSLGLLFWCNRSDTVVNQVDLQVPNTPLVSSGNDNDLDRRSSVATSERNYKLLP